MERWRSFRRNESNTLGVEIELQLINLNDYNLSHKAYQLIEALSSIAHPGTVQPEITMSMIEINSSVHHNYQSLATELNLIRQILIETSKKIKIGIAGGGSHPLQMWQDQIIYPAAPFINDYDLYGYLSKQITVFGQHIHVGCADGDEAIYLCHAFTIYMPHLIALAASSPFYQGVDTEFDCTRLNSMAPLPFSGTIPWLNSWQEYMKYMETIFKLGYINSIKDFYWDVRPQPEFGTIEIRVCDTPLQMSTCVTLAAYAQILALYLLENRQRIEPDMYNIYSYNRFNAMRYGLFSNYIHPHSYQKILLKEHILKTCNELIPYARKLKSELILDNVKKIIIQGNDATRLRAYFKKVNCVTEIVRAQANAWESDEKTLISEMAE